MDRYRTQSGDTTRDAEEVLFAGLRRLSSIEKARMIRAASVATDRWVRAGLRHRHPEASDEELRALLARSRLGDELYERIYGREE